MMTFSAIRGAQIIDVTKECTFEWSYYIPDTITAGTFPDSIISRDLDNYLEFEKTLTGAGYLGRLVVEKPTDSYFIPVIVAGVGHKVDSDNNALKQVSGFVSTSGKMWVTGPYLWLQANSTHYDCMMGTNLSLGIAYGKYLIVYYYVNNQGTYRGRFHRIRILEVKI